MKNETKVERKERMKAEAQEFLDAAKPLIKYLNDRGNPHSKVIVDVGSAELLNGCMTSKTEEFYHD